jgi:hypothetical protein
MTRQTTNRKLVLRNCYIEIDGVDFSSHCSAVTVNMSKADIDTTNFGGTGQEHQHGLKDDSFELNMQSDFNAGSVDAVLYPLYDQEYEFTVTVKPTSAPISASNPQYSGTCLLLDYSPLDGTVGKLSDTKLKIPTQRSGIARTTAS